jgi:MFS family permease
MLIQSIVLGVLTWTGTVQIWHVYVMAFLLGTLKAVDMPARQSFIVEMVNGKEDLTSAIGLNSAIHNSAKTLGPALAGVIIAMLGEAIAFFSNGLSFLAVIISLLFMTDLPQTIARQEAGPVLTHTVQGVKYVLGQQTLLILMSLIAVSSFLSRPYQTLMPVFSNTTLKESAQPIVRFLCNGEKSTVFNCQAPEAIPLGLLLSAVGLGAIMGAFLIASLPEYAPRGRLLTVGNLSFPLLLLLFVYSHSMGFSLFLMILVGLSHVFQNAMANTLLQLSSPDPLRGRVMSLYALVSHGMHHLGGLQAGFMADWIGAPISIGAGAAVSLLYGFFVAVRYRQVRNLA